jgi:hypothetical protein
MSRSFCLVAISARRFVNLGARGRRDDWEFEGPVVWIDSRRYRLPADLLEQLVARFRERHGETSVAIRPLDEQFESDGIWSHDEGVIEVAGDSDGNIPLSEYLPELDDPETRRRIQFDTTLDLKD